MSLLVIRNFSTTLILFVVFCIILLFQTASGNCNQLKDNSDNKITLVPSTSVHNSCADIQVTQSVSLASQQIPAVLTPSHFPSEAPQTSLPISNSNSNSSQMTTSSKQPPLSTAPEIAQISADNNEGMLDNLPVLCISILLIYYK